MVKLAESLLQKADKMSMAASIELRTPFIDVPLATAAARLHPSLKLGADTLDHVDRVRVWQDPDAHEHGFLAGETHLGVVILGPEDDIGDVA